MFTQGWLLLGFFLVAVGLGTRMTLAFTSGVILLLGSLLSYLGDRYSLARVEYRRRFTPRRAFCGEEITFTLEVVNRKLLPLAWVEVTDELPEALVPRKGRVLPSLRQRRQHLVHIFTLRWFERIRRRIALKCTARGYFALGPAYLRSGDPFGFTTRIVHQSSVDHLIVYPRIVPVDALELPALHPLGDARRHRPLLEDPTQVVGTRDYAYGDPLRRIHWKATARLQSLQSKLYAPSTAYRLAIFLNLDTLGEYAGYRGFIRDVLEMLLVVAGSLANWAIEQGMPVGLFANGYLPGALKWVRLPPSASPGQLMLILEALAKVFPTPVLPVGDLMQLEARDLPWGSTALVVTSVVDEPLRAGVVRLVEAGHAAVVILVGRRSPNLVDLGGVPVCRVDGTQRWDEIAVVRLRERTSTA